MGKEHSRMVERPQVDTKHYYEEYDDVFRFISYFHQIDIVRRVAPSNILEVGVGNKTVSDYLKARGLSVTTCDFDASLNPDHVADIRDLPFDSDSFELVMACEVLEHLPWSDFEKAVSELHRVSKRYVLISLPCYSVRIDAALRGPLIRKLAGKDHLKLSIRIFKKIRTERVDDEHYWEIDGKRYSLKKLRNILSKRFKITDEVIPLLNSYHHFFLLEKIRAHNNS